MEFGLYHAYLESLYSLFSVKVKTTSKQLLSRDRANNLIESLRE